MGAGVRSGSNGSGEEERAREREEGARELMNLYCGVTFLRCSPFLTENTVINLHLQSLASQREDQSGYYPGYSGLLDLNFMTREANLQLQSFYTPLHLSLSIAKMLQRWLKLWQVIQYGHSDWWGLFLGRSLG